MRSPCFQHSTALLAAGRPSNHHPRPRGHEPRPSRQTEGSQGTQTKQGRRDHDAAARSQPSSSSGRLQQWRGCALHRRGAEPTRLRHGFGAEVMPKLATGLRGEETNHRTRRVAGTLFRIDIDSAIARDSSHVDRASGRRRAGATKNAPK